MLGNPYYQTVSFVPRLMLIRFGKVVGAILLLFTMGMLVARPLFYRMASKPFEYLKKAVKPKRNRRIPQKLSPLWIELLSMLKSIDKVFSNVGVLISIPLLTFLLNKIFLAMNTRSTGEYMIVAFNVLIIMLISLNSNCKLASVYSRDGRSSYLIKTQPVKYHVLLVSKLVPSALTVCLSLIGTMVLFFSTVHLRPIDITTLILALMLIYLAHMFYSAEQDIMNPQSEIYATMGEHENNPNEMRSSVTAFIISFVIAGATFLLLSEGRGYVYLKLLLVGLAAVLYCAWSFFDKIKLYYKEK